MRKLGPRLLGAANKRAARGPGGEVGGEVPPLREGLGVKKLSFRGLHAMRPEASADI